MIGVNQMRKIDPVELETWRAFFQGRPEVAAVYIFGSYGTEFQHAQSDIDLGIVYTRLVNLSDELALDADLSLYLQHDHIDLVNLDRAPIALQHRALAEGLLVYEGDYLKTSDFIEHVNKYYPDYAIKYKMMAKYYEAAVKEGDRGNG